MVNQIVSALPTSVAVSVDWFAILGGDGMTLEILPAQEIIDNAHAAAEAGLPATACPYPATSAHAKRWMVAFYGREKELRAEVEACSCF